MLSLTPFHAIKKEVKQLASSYYPKLLSLSPYITTIKSTSESLISLRLDLATFRSSILYTLFFPYFAGSITENRISFGYKTKRIPCAINFIKSRTNVMTSF